MGAEQAYCSACDLKHERQPDWLCPQCGMPVETEAWRSMVRRPTGEDEAEPEFPTGSFAAGAAMVLTSLVLAIGFARNPVSAHRWPLVAAMVLLAVLGLELLLKVSWARWVALALASAALLFAMEDLLRARLPELMRDPLPPAIRAALHGPIGALSTVRLLTAGAMLGGTLLLVIGRPGRRRIVAGLVVAAPLAVGEIVRMILS